MQSDIKKLPRSVGRKSLFYQDLASPISPRRTGGKFSTPGQAAAVSALWRENFASSDLPPPPVFTLDDKIQASPEMGIPAHPVSPDIKSDPRTPISSFSRQHSTPRGKTDATSSYDGSTKTPLQQSQQSPLLNSSLWTPAKSRGSADSDDRGKGSPVEGVVQPGALITVPRPREVARPELKKSFPPIGGPDEEEWVTVYGFSPADTNLVLREFEKCGVILRHVPGPGSANWMHILYQHRSDAQKALGKNGMDLNGVLIIGVKPVDPMQRQALDSRLNNPEFLPLPPPASSTGFESNGFKASLSPTYIQTSASSLKQPSGTIATPARSLVSKVMDLMFGV